MPLSEKGVDKEIGSRGEENPVEDQFLTQVNEIDEMIRQSGLDTNSLQQSRESKKAP